MIDKTGIKTRFEALSPHLDERSRRLFAASEARAAGYGGIAAVSEVTGIARSTVGRGLSDLDAGGEADGRIRRIGGGRKQKSEIAPDLLPALNELVQSAIRGDPQAPLLWVSRSQRNLAKALIAQGIDVTHTKWYLQCRQ